MKKLFVFIAVAVFIAAAAMASFIRLQTSVTTNLNQGVLKTSVSVVNKGDEPAHNVQAELRVAGQKILLDKVSQLGVNAKYSAAKKVKLNLDQPGQYPLVVVMHYTDG
ncbi:MAG: hypothetical protein KJ811_05120, partial [Candidatus Margulisbacteria bacterium]|nr:hypothetical protein [Candidatus Margulisiibacteriota bacterium]